MAIAVSGSGGRAGYRLNQHRLPFSVLERRAGRHPQYGGRVVGQCASPLAPSCG